MFKKLKVIDFKVRFLPIFLGKWIPILGKFYHFSQERITFAKAKATCEHNLGKLFEPTTEAINNEIAAKARDKGIVNPWIGIHHLHDENRTVFSSDNTTVAWSNWDINEPNNENEREECVHLYNERNEYSCAFSWIGDGNCNDVNNNEECYWDDFDCSCHVSSWIGDGYCDDESNKEECGWDGGDCCGNNVNTDYCTVCECHEPKCKYEHINNGICDDEFNNEECNLDGGDCCGDDVVMTECSTCECLEPFKWNDDNCDEYRRFICEKEGTG